MRELTPEAQQKLDAYLHRMRNELSGSKSVTAEEVEQNVREHIEFALAGGNGPIDSARIGDVLDRLGAPEQWLPDDERPAWRRAMARLQAGPEEWRLAYASFALFLIALLLVPVGIGVLLMFASYVVSRAYVELMRNQGEPLGARRWLVYPPIALLLVAMLAASIVGPAASVIAWGIGEHGFERIFDVPQSFYGHLRFQFGMGGIIFGSWWMIAAGLMTVFLRPIRFVFSPLLDGLRARHVTVLAVIGAVIATAGGVLVYYR
ncbi:MAG TPA: hypothetical protein VL284_09925 [Thermoanaerobaculia bacterium]|nr:hypothetical protein [Thermoanaerobaculia bacterium]